MSTFKLIKYHTSNIIESSNYRYVQHMEARPKNTFDHSAYLFWKNEIEAALDWRKDFTEAGDKIVKRYREDDSSEYTKTYNILYSNTETLAPVVYDNAPRAEVRANNLSEVSSRKSAELFEKAINYYINTADFNNIARASVLDFLLSGEGQIRPKYNFLEDKIKVDEENEEERVAYEFVEFEYVYWKDFIYPQSSRWDDLPWLAFRAYLTYDEAVEQFGVEKASQLKYSPCKSGMDQGYSKKDDSIHKAEVFEIWDKFHRQRLFFANSNSGALIEIDDDPLELEDFFPVPPPLQAITTSGTLLPVPFFKQYQNQADQLDDVNQRLYYMVDAMKRRGVFDAATQELGNIQNLQDNQFIGVNNWNDFVSKGGLSGVLQSEDITPYANVISILLQAKQQLLDDIFQIIGLADIRRAQTDPRETLGAQKLKSRYGTIRISTYQKKVQEFMRNLIKITGEIIVNKFDAETLSLVTSTPMDTNIIDGKVETVGTIDLLDNLRSKYPTDLVIDIQTDSTIIEDNEEDRAAMADAISSMAQFTQIAPGLSQSLGLQATSKILMGIIEKYKLGRDIQQEVTDHIKRLEGQEGQPQEATEAEIDMQKKQMEIQLEQQKLNITAQVEAAKLRVKQQENLIKAQELGIKADVEREKINLQALDQMLDIQRLEVEAMRPGNEVAGG